MLGTFKHAKKKIFASCSANSFYYQRRETAEVALEATTMPRRICFLSWTMCCLVGLIAASSPESQLPSISDLQKTNLHGWREARKTVQYRHPCGVWTLLVRFASRFIGDPLCRFWYEYLGITYLQMQDNKSIGGEGGIRTPDTLSGMPVFKTGAINHSATSPAITVLLQSSMARDRHKLFRPVWIHQYLAGFARL